MGPLPSFRKPAGESGFWGAVRVPAFPGNRTGATLSRPGNCLGWAGPRKMSEPCKPGFLFHGRSIEIRGSAKT